MSTNPQDLAAARWGPVRRAETCVAEAERKYGASRARVQQLEAEIGPAEHRDRQALGRALVDGKPEPASEAAELKSELEQEQRRADALARAVEDARNDIRATVAANKGKWRHQTMQQLATAQRRYLDAIDELDAARDALSDQAALVAWIDTGAGTAAASDPLGGRIGHGSTGRQPLSFARVLEELRADATAIAQHPVTRDDPAAEPKLELAWSAGRR
jgi:hypothetical protein